MALTNKLKAIADAIRERTGRTEPMTLDEMAEIILTMDFGGTTSVFAPLYEKFSINKSEFPIVAVCHTDAYISLGFAKEIVGKTDGSYTLKYGHLQSTYDTNLGMQTLEDAINACMSFTSVMDKTSSDNMMALRDDDKIYYCNAPIVKGSFVNYIE